MPLEALKCPSCGSADVTEFKLGSYVCGHCEGIFKYVEPPAAINVRNEFCRCGNIIQAQCAICRTGMCADCGSGSKLDRKDPIESADGWYTLVTVATGGYALQVQAGIPVGLPRNASLRDLPLVAATAPGRVLQCRSQALDNGEWSPVRVDESGMAVGYVSAAKVWTRG